MAAKTSLEKICPMCGASSKAIPFIGPFCQTHSQVSVHPPKHVLMTHCSMCDMIKLYDWGRFSDEQIEDYVLQKIKSNVKCESINYDMETQTAKFFIDYKGSIVSLERKIPLEFAKEVCPQCSRKAGGAYQAIIQFRSPNKERAYKAALKTEKYLEQKSFVCKLEKLKEGWDLYAGEKEKVFEVLNLFGYSYLRTEKLHGMSKEGKNLYRSTFLVRL